MRRFIILGCLFFIALFDKIQAQTVIDFVANPTATGPNTWDPTYWDRGGCGSSQKWGPNPLPVNGYNIRLVGSSSIYPLPPARALYLYAGRNDIDGAVKTHTDHNAILSIEYPFKANKSYLIEIVGIKDEGVWSDGGDRPKRYKKAVFWVKLQDSPIINTPSHNPCGWDLHPVDKNVGRYSKLIADPRIVLEDTTYKVKFSVLENKSALKIIFDPSPADPNLSFDSQFGLRRIKITEMPYEEDGPRYYASYSNVPRPPRSTPGYDITSINDPSSAPTNPGRSTFNDFTINPDQWILDYDGVGYSVYLKDIIQNFNFSTLIDVLIKGDTYTNPRTGQVSNENIILPGSYQNNQYEYQLINGEVVLSVKNTPNAAPSIPINGQISYYK